MTKKYLFILTIFFSFYPTLLSQISSREPDCCLLIKESVILKFFPELFNMTVEEQDFFRVFFDRVAEIRQIAIVNSERTIKKLSGYDDRNNPMPKSIATSNYLGQETKANCYLEWNFNSQSRLLDINIFMQENNTKKILVSGRYTIPTKMNNSISYFNAIGNAVNDIINQSLARKK